MALDPSIIESAKTPNFAQEMMQGMYMRNMAQEEQMRQMQMQQAQLALQNKLGMQGFMGRYFGAGQPNQQIQTPSPNLVGPTQPPQIQAQNIENNNRQAAFNYLQKAAPWEIPQARMGLNTFNLNMATQKNQAIGQLYQDVLAAKQAGQDPGQVYQQGVQKLVGAGIVPQGELAPQYPGDQIAKQEFNLYNPKNAQYLAHIPYYEQYAKQKAAETQSLGLEPYKNNQLLQQAQQSIMHLQPGYELLNNIAQGKGKFTTSVFNQLQGLISPDDKAHYSTWHGVIKNLETEATDHPHTFDSQAMAQQLINEMNSYRDAYRQQVGAQLKQTGIPFDQNSPAYGAAKNYYDTTMQNYGPQHWSKLPTNLVLGNFNKTPSNLAAAVTATRPTPRATNSVMIGGHSLAELMAERARRMAARKVANR